MNVLKHTDKNFLARLSRLTSAAPLFDDAIDRSVRAILKSVRRDGDQALVRFAKKYDNVVIFKKDLRVTSEQFRGASSLALQKVQI